MLYLALNGNVTVQRGIFWTIGEYSHFGIISYYILLCDKWYIGLNIWVLNNRVRLHCNNCFIVILNFYPSKYYGTYCTVLGTLVVIIRLFKLLRGVVH